MKFYADVHKTKKNKERYRITYTTDGTTFKHVDSFSEIPAKPGDRLFMDILPPQHTDGAIELLRRGVEVYYLRRLTLIEKIRREHKLPNALWPNSTSLGPSFVCRILSRMHVY